MTPDLLRLLTPIRDRARAKVGRAVAAGRAIKPPVMIGLVGAGIGASRSPAMHEGEGQRLGIPYAYELIDADVLGFGAGDLPAILAWARQADFTGLNVTHPFKQTIIPHLSTLSADAAAIAAVNTVVFRDGLTMAFNTDTSGFAESFRRELFDAPRAHVVQVGAGGAGAAVALALARLGVSRLSLFDIERAKAQALAQRLVGEIANGRIEVVTDLEATLAGTDGVINATPVGMAKYPGLPFERRQLRRGLWVADVVYFPRETELLAQARSIGCRTLSGIGMAVFQAVHAFKLFSGEDADPNRMQALLEQAG